MLSDVFIKYTRKKNCQHHYRYTENCHFDICRNLYSAENSYPQRGWLIKIDNNNSTRRFFTLSFTFINVVIDYVTRRTLATIMIMNLFRSQEIVAFFNKHKKERKNLPC